MKPYDRLADSDRPDDVDPDTGKEYQKWQTESGRVTLSAPAGTVPYYRIEWYDADGKRQQSTARRTFAWAWAKAVERERLLAAGATPKTEQPASVGIEYWLDPSRPTPKGGWGGSHRKNMARYARYYFTPLLGKVRHQDLRRSHLQKCVNAAPNSNEGANVRRALSSLIEAMRQGDYLLENQVLSTRGVWWHGAPAAQVTEPARIAGEDDGYVERYKRPSAAQVEALRIGAEQTGRGIWWRGLMVELAAGAGPREGELWALTADSVRADRRLPIDWQVEEVAGRQQLSTPKGKKRRTSIWKATTETGYDLEGALWRRVDEVRAEQAEGRNPQGLLFPSSAGTWLRSGNFHRDIFEPAALAAGFAFEWRDRPSRDKAGNPTTVRVRDWELPWHALRHHFCTVALEAWRLPDTVVAVLAGHESSDFTRKKYVGSAEDTVAKALAATA